MLKQKYELNNNKNAVIYARYSSSSQTEQSIEGQLHKCHAFAEKMGYTVINEYIDRGKTGTNANRPAFQNMISDSEKGLFSAIIVYMVDRFACSKEDSVLYKALLRRNGVKVLYAEEQIGDTDEGFLIEGLLEMFAEQYSTKLSKRVKHGLAETRAKGNYTGGQLLIGYKIVDRKVAIDEERAPIIQEVFEKYANGVAMKDIVGDLNKRGIRTNRGTKFSINSLQDTLCNKKYIGEYYFNNEKFDCYPAIIDKEIFDKVQARKNSNKHAPATQKAKVEYLLYGKAFCGYCGSNIVGVSARGRHGEKHCYYACAKKYKSHTCKKKSEVKDNLEIAIVSYVKNYLCVKENAYQIADLVLAEYKRYITTSRVTDVELKLKEIDKQLDDIVDTTWVTKKADMRIKARLASVAKKQEIEDIITFLRGVVLSLTSEIIFFSAFSTYCFSSSLSPDKSSFILIPKKLHSGSIKLISGKPLPVSHFEIVFSDTCNCSATSRCVKDLSFLKFLIN